MNKNEFPRVVIAGTQSGVGKTTISMGLMAALRKHKRIQPFKVGPDYIDPAYHTFITGRKSRNLDGWMLQEDQVIYLFRKNMAGAQAAVIEGVMGLFDGGDGGQGSTAHVAKTLSAPVILVMDGSGMSLSGAAMARGYRDFDRGVNVCGVIFNQISSESHYQLLKEAVEEEAGLRVFGYLPRGQGLELPSRHLGLVPSGEVSGLRDKISCLAGIVEKTIDVEGILSFMEDWSKPLPQVLTKRIIPQNITGRGRVPIGVAYDEAFNFYYWDNLELMEELGAELVYFSPLRDSKLPEPLGGIVLGGGFPEVFAPILEGNGDMRRAIKKTLEGGIPYYAECGGLMYLAESLENLAGESFNMVGWLEGKCIMTPRLQRFGYANLELKQDCVWGKTGQTMKVHEFHHSQMELADPDRIYFLSKWRKGRVIKEWECGYLKGRGVAGYPHLHFYSNIEVAQSFVNSASQYFRDKENT